MLRPAAPSEFATIHASYYQRAGRHHEWVFELIDENGDILALTDPFRASKPWLAREPEPERALRAFVDTLKADGWVLADAPADKSEWWAWQFARGERNPVVRQTMQRQVIHQAALNQQVSRSSGIPGVWWMWGLTMAIVIGIFACCVILVLTSEVRFSPQQ